MKVLVTFSALLFLTYPSLADTIVIKPGKTQTLTRENIFSRIDNELVVTCENEAKCTINYEFIGKNFSLKMPNGRKYGTYKTVKEAMMKSSALISSKICDRLILNLDEDKIE